MLLVYWEEGSLIPRSRVRGKEEEAGRGKEKMPGAFVGDSSLPHLHQNIFLQGTTWNDYTSRNRGGCWRLGLGQEEGKDLLVDSFLALSLIASGSPKPMP